MSEQKPKPTVQIGKPVATPVAPLPPTPAPKPKEPATTTGPTLFHFAECTNCRHLLPLSTTTEKYFAMMSKEKDLSKPVGLGEKCMRCGADSWVLVRG